MPFSRCSARAHRTKVAGWRGARGFITNCSVDSFSHPRQLSSPTHIQVSGLHLPGSGEAPGRLGQPLCQAHNRKHPAAASQTGLQAAVTQTRDSKHEMSQARVRARSSSTLLSSPLPSPNPKPSDLTVTLHLECSLSPVPLIYSRIFTV